MIKLTGLDNREFYLNSDLLEKLEITPDTVITLTNGKKLIVKQDPEVIIDLIVDYKKRFMWGGPEVIK